MYGIAHLGTYDRHCDVLYLVIGFLWLDRVSCNF